MDPITTFNFDDYSIGNEMCLDNPERLDYVDSFWQRFFHPIKNRDLNQEIRERIISLFKERYGFHETDHFIRIWNKIGEKIWTAESILTAGVLRSIDHAFKKQLVYHGPGIVPPPAAMTASVDASVQSLMLSLLHGATFSRSILNVDAFKTIFINHTHNDSKLMTEFFEGLQREFVNLAANLPKNNSEEIVWRAFFGNLVALLPYCYPRNGFNLSIPILSKNIDGTYSCSQATYHIEEIDLVYNERNTPMKALGLTSSEGPPFLVYIGTTYPGGEGFAATLLADFTPGYSVGQHVYERNQIVIDDWLKDKQGVSVFGTSLGGAMALHTLHDYHEKISRIDVYNPPGLYPGQWVNQLSEECSINIWCQSGDIVSHMGVWPTDPHVSLYLLVPHQEGLDGSLSAHARAFSGCPDVTVLKLDPELENAKKIRSFLTFLHQVGSWLVYAALMISIWMTYLISSISKRLF